MKKLIALCMTISLVAITLGPALSVANGTILTGLIRSTGGGASPIIKAKWEMNGPYASLLGTDDSTAAGAQFRPTGIWGDRQNPDQGEKHFSICAIVTDPDGVSDIDGVYTDWYYPSNRAYHSASSMPDLTNGGPDQGCSNPNGDISPRYDYGVNACGAPYEDENELHQLSKIDGYNLFCNTIRGHNYNLPTFFPMPTGGLYHYDEICGETGELMKEEAYVYCADKTLEWEDPAGDYKVEILSLDKAGMFSHEGEINGNFNHFQYLPLTAFEADFDRVAYGSVKLNTHKIISGDLTWDNGTGPNPASVRNVGNTRLYMWVEQDDMDLGTTDGKWNVQYDARVGNRDLDWRIYSPEENQPLEDILDLSEIEEMDFSVVITKFPSTQNEWTGTMNLSATPAEFRQCQPN